ncbi:GNAT family N-acetyltransferase [Candidatus Gracilibacteria bacterium]|nr:GNAT family N-acetyltransferase [Candidatus Gracilibacteria bacterium]
MSIRKANKTDKVQIQTLMNELNLYRKNIFSPDNQKFHERLTPYPPLQDADFDESLIFVAANDSAQIVGFIQGSVEERKNHKLSKLGYIDEIYVQKEARGQGVAKNLFSELQSEFKNQGCDHMTTHTDFENELSQQFYSKAGMHKATVELWQKL